MKEVVIIKIPGAKEANVNTAIICSVADTSCGLSAVPTPILILGIKGAASALLVSINIKAMHDNSNKLRLNSMTLLNQRRFFKFESFCIIDDNEPNSSENISDAKFLDSFLRRSISSGSRISDKSVID